MWFIGVEVEQETSAPPPKKNPGSAPVMRARLRGQDFATGKNFSFNRCHTKSCVFSREIYFIKAIENFFPVFA